MKHIGACYDSQAWGGDLSGILVRIEPEGPRVIASHISSNVDWSQRDIQGHYDRREELLPDDSFEWIGQLTPAEIGERFIVPGATGDGE